MMREETTKLVVATLVIMTLGMIFGCCGFYLVQKLLSLRNTTKKIEEPTISEPKSSPQPVCAEDVITARKHDGDIKSLDTDYQTKEFQTETKLNPENIKNMFRHVRQDSEAVEINKPSLFKKGESQESA